MNPRDSGLKIGRFDTRWHSNPETSFESFKNLYETPKFGGKD